MQFQPKTEKEIREAQLASPGDYDFEVLKAQDETSKKGNPMIHVKLGIYNGDAIRWHVDDYLLAAMEAKLRHFADTAGLLASYESGQLCAADCTGRAGRVRLVVQEGEGNYPDKNSVKDYIVRPAKPLPGPKPAAETPTGQAPAEDDVPF